MKWFVQTNVALAVLFATSALPTTSDAANEQVLKLAKERLALVSQLHEMTLATYKTGVTSLSEVLEVRGDLLAARLDACETKAERIKVLEDMVKTAEEIKNVTERLVAAGEAPQSKLLKARVHVLDARILLEKEKAAP